MFAHAEATEQKEYDCGIWQGHQQSMSEQDPSMETLTVDLIGYKTTKEEIFALYDEVYKLKRARRSIPGDPREAEEVHQEILYLLKECLWHRQGSTQPEEPEQESAGRSRPDQWSNFQQRMQVTYDNFWSRWQESSEKLGILPSGAGSGCPVGRPHRELELLCHSWVVWQPWMVHQLWAIKQPPAFMQ